MLQEKQNVAVRLRDDVSKNVVIGVLLVVGVVLVIVALVVVVEKVKRLIIIVAVVKNHQKQ